ncbi:branched-chain amino acid ABC transporter permease [Glaciimonas sp. CA11.2]|uniref:branched-chain amino acid ABC transporter permease n=1 Tax=unclassified Glaciimonas TaxID=2644401 RepID=UPI002AB47229|nr:MULTISPECIES: branched-chain amino acid ABC transporter permease [unclassified Glaciimonas]MDY7548925.1 branched-chain amino acid ABC transporter permease [Glaciimonas sp. CA11.2]MEB0013623.1 branched-chain amino acid ABC transporter permease [Glaciimonas sp. Cout2]MEB0083649.1 branched-chain amino acid ABC transporter permease [Glaciimonas sp. Gout2]MEB0162978.1 branched-chain amino acid ABC transporter permease [Glaciimonas sp. CA11.2]
MNVFFDNLLWTYQTLLTQVGIGCLLALSLYWVIATGQLFLGQVAFMAMGAYTSATLSMQFGLPLWMSVLMAIAFATAVAALIVYPMLRLSGVHMAIGTIAFVAVVRSVVINMEFLGGALGISGVPHPVSLATLYLIVCLVAAGMLWISKSRIGRNMEAVRTDEVAAAVMGINVGKVKLTCVLISSALAGLAGALNAHAMGSISPNEFTFQSCVTVLSYVVLGGIASPLGGILGAIVLIALPEMLSGLAEYRTMFNGLVIVVVVMLLPSGLFPIKTLRIRGYVNRR